MTLTTTGGLPRADDGRVAAGNGDRPRRRTYTAEYKTQILAEYDALPVGSAERGALLRREGLYSSHLAEWRKARDAAVTAGLAPRVRQPAKTADQLEVERLRKANAKLAAELERTKTALEITGKVHALLEQLSESADTDPPSKR
jgi:transposase-like protein